ncbi:MAG: protein kinase [Acidobacteria bacterium]|nr:protein kinase [Acidobacteriota bacterium]
MSDKKILVADYNTRELQQLKKIFTDAGFNVVTVQDGKAALDSFEADKPDVVLLSAMLSKINGFDVCRKIKDTETGRNVPVIIATSVYKGQKYRNKALHENGASEFIEKPVPDNVILETVQRFMGDTRSLIDTRRSEFIDKIAKESAAEAPPAPPPKPAPTPAAKAPAPPPQPAPEPPRPKPAPAAPKPTDVESRFEQEIAATLIASEAPAAAEMDDSMDKLLSDTLSGLGLDLDKGKSKASPPRAPAPPPPVISEAKKTEAALEKLVESASQATAPPPPLLGPDTGEIRFDQLKKEVKEAGAPAAAKVDAVEDFLRSFYTDLEKKLSDTLSGVGLSDTSIDKVIQPKAQEPAPAAPKPKPAPAPVPLAEPEHEEGTKFGDYILDRKIGHGGMAELFRAKKRGQEGFQKIVAIKRILPHLSDNQELVTMFIDEAKIAAQLSHQNIVTIFDFGKINHSFYIAMEFVDGFDFKKILSRAKELGIRLPHKLAAHIALQIASALDYAHFKKDFSNKEMNIVHRDVSPQNILISREGEVKLVDFGISKAESKIHHTVKGALKGKLLYMSPEQAWGKPVDKRSDLFSLGIVLCEAISGKVLFEDSSEFDVLEKVRSGKIPILENEMPSLPPRLKNIINKALQIDIGQRYQTAGEMAKDLHDYLSTGKQRPSPKDLATFLTRMFPDAFGMKESEVRNLSFDEFMEREDVLPPKAMSEETVILESEEMAGLEEIRPAADIPVALEEDEIVVDGKFQPPPLVKEAVPPKKAAAPLITPVEEKPAVIRKEKKKAPEPVKPKAEPVKAKAEPVPPKKEAPPPKKEAVPPPKKEAVTPPAEEKKVLTKRLKEKPAAEKPMFGDVTTASKSSSKGLIIGIIAAVVIIAVGVATYLMFFSKPAVPTQPEPPAAGATEPAAPGEPVPSTGEPTAPTGTTPTATPATATDVKPETRPQPQPAPAKPGQPATVAQQPQPQPKPEPAKPAAAAATQPTAAQPAAPKPEPAAQPAAQPAAPKPEPTPPPAAPKPEPTTQPAAQPAAPKPEPTSQPTAPKPEPVKPASPPPAADIPMDLPAVAEKAKTGDLVALGPDVKPPKELRTPSPRIPAQAQRLNLKGRLVCRLLVSHTGEVERVLVVSADSARVKEMLGPAAEEALKQWRYTPAEKDGVKVKVWKTVTLSF